MAEILIGTATTNASGIASFTNLPPGNYKYVQTTAKTGYTADTTERNVTISSATPVAESRTNAPTEVGTLRIRKHVNGNVNLPVPGSAFKLMDSTGKTMLAVSSLSDADGYIIFTNLMTITGTPQQYQVLEATAPTGFELNTTTFTNAVTVNNTVTQEVPNTPTVTGELDVNLTDSYYSEYTLAGADYELYWITN